MTQMHVFPDVLPEFEPTVDVRVRLNGHSLLEPGKFVLPSQVRSCLCTAHQRVSLADRRGTDRHTDPTRTRARGAGLSR